MSNVIWVDFRNRKRAESEYAVFPMLGVYTAISNAAALLGTETVEDDILDFIGFTTKEE